MATQVSVVRLDSSEREALGQVTSSQALTPVQKAVTDTMKECRKGIAALADTTYLGTEQVRDLLNQLTTMRSILTTVSSNEPEVVEYQRSLDNAIHQLEGVSSTGSAAGSDHTAAA